MKVLIGLALAILAATGSAGDGRAPGDHTYGGATGPGSAGCVAGDDATGGGGGDATEGGGGDATKTGVAAPPTGAPPAGASAAPSTAPTATPRPRRLDPLQKYEDVPLDRERPWTRGRM